jgi:hypothetical protein
LFCGILKLFFRRPPGLLKQARHFTELKLLLGLGHSEFIIFTASPCVYLAGPLIVLMTICGIFCSLW